MNETRSIKVKVTTYRRLKVLAARLGMTMLDLVDQLVERAEHANSTGSSAGRRPADGEPQQDAEHGR